MFQFPFKFRLILPAAVLSGLACFTFTAAVSLASEIPADSVPALTNETDVPTDWMRDARLGVFTHFLPWNQEQFQLTGKYDAKAVAKQLHELGVKYFVFTIYQNSGFMNAPNAEYESVTGFAPGEKCSKRDLPMELADALEPYGIRLILYITAQTPNQDAAAQEKFGLSPAPKDLVLNPEFARKYARVFQEWSDRYGKKVSGWWVDGSYEWCRFSEEIAQIYSAALKHGNPDAIVAFNPGVKRAEWKTSDYSAGEINQPFEYSISDRFNENGQQNQILTFLGTRWGASDCRFTVEQWSSWIQSVVDRGGAVTLDACPNMDPKAGPIGTLNPEQAAQIKAIRERIH